MKSIFREIFLCLLIGAASVGGFVAVGAMRYAANEHTILVNLLVWTGVVLAAYVLFIFIPFFHKRKYRYLDGLAFASGYLGVAIACMACAKSFTEYNYLETISFMSGFLALAELVVTSNRRIQQKITEKSVPRPISDAIGTLSAQIRGPSIKMAKAFGIGNIFTLHEAAMAADLTERKTRDVIRCLVEHKLIQKTGKASGSGYLFVNLSVETLVSD